MNIKLMTYNIMSGRNYQEFKAGKHWLDESLIQPSLVSKVIKEQCADIVGMNEVHGEGFIFDNQTERIAKEAGYDYFYFAQSIIDRGSPYGNAVLSKYPIVDAETISLEAGDFNEDERSEARSIAKVIIDINGQKIMVLVSHFGLAASEKRIAVETIKKLLAKSDYSCVLMGDLNMTPDEPLIQELKCILKDTAPEEIDESWYTHSSDEPSRKIDYIFVDKTIKVEKAKALESEASDHKPYYADITIE